MLDSLHHFNLFSTVLGVVICLVLNLLLIPFFGPIGAAWATVISYMFAAYLSSYFTQQTFRIARIQTSSLIFGPIRLLGSFRSPN